MQKNEKECPSCAMDVSESASVCPICGYEFPRQNRVVQWVAIVLIVAFAIMILYRVM